MGNVLIKSKIDVLIAKNPTIGEILDYKDKVITNEYQGSDYAESAGGMFAVPKSTSDMDLSMGTVVYGHLLCIEVDADLELKIENAIGTSQKLVFKPGIASILNMDFTALSVSNSSTTVAVTGRYCVVGNSYEGD